MIFLYLGYDCMTLLSSSVFQDLINVLSEFQYGVHIAGESCDQVVETTLPSVSCVCYWPNRHFDMYS